LDEVLVEMERRVKAGHSHIRRQERLDSSRRKGVGSGSGALWDR